MSSDTSWLVLSALLLQPLLLDDTEAHFSFDREDELFWQSTCNWIALSNESLLCTEFETLFCNRSFGTRLFESMIVPSQLTVKTLLFWGRSSIFPIILPLIASIELWFFKSKWWSARAFFYFSNRFTINCINRALIL